MTNSFSADRTRDVSRAIETDKENLFSLADKVIAAAPLRQWGVWIADATSSYFLAQFMRDTYAASNKVAGNPPPIIHVANSRSVRDNSYHQQTVLDHLSQPELPIAGRNALILCEYTKDRNALSRLSVPLRQAGALAVDAAVLNLETPGLYARPTDKPDVIYAGEPHIYEPALYDSVLKRAVGQISVCGEPAPQDKPDVDLGLRAYVSDAFTELAEEYVLQATS